MKIFLILILGILTFARYESSSAKFYNGWHSEEHTKYR